jgi:hypothetical protein
MPIYRGILALSNPLWKTICLLLCCSIFLLYGFSVLIFLPFLKYSLAINKTQFRLFAHFLFEIRSLFVYIFYNPYFFIIHNFEQTSSML